MIIGTLTLVMVTGELVQWQRQARFDTMGECEAVMQQERIQISAQHDTLLSMATCSFGGQPL